MGGRVTARKPKPKVCLVMIVKDEEAILEERLRNVLGEIDGWLIVDTGSTDRTVEICQKVLDGVPGRVQRLPWDWDGFARARSYAVAEAAHWAKAQGGEWWALLLDADTIFSRTAFWRRDVLEGWGDRPRDLISCDVVHGSIRYLHPRLLRLGAHEWRWRGVLHEYLEVPMGALGAYTDLVFVEHGSGGARSKDPLKFYRDAELLAAERIRLALDPDHPDRDLAPRYCFYEAQSWRDAGRPAQAEGCYLARTKLGGFFQEVYLAWLNVGELRVAEGELAGALEAFTRAWAVDPSRAEALVGLATVCRAWEAWWPAYHYGSQARVVAPGSAGMFADQNVGWRADFEVSVAAWYCGKLGEGQRACERVLASPLASEAVKERTRANLALYVPRGAA